MAQPKKKTTKSSLSQINETDKPSQPLRLRDLIRAQGASGTYIVHGFLEQDYLSDVAGTRGLDKFDEMRKSDAQVRATLDAMELPIRSTEWMIEPGTNENGETDDFCEEVRAFIEDALFKKMEQTWDDHLREVLTFLPFGFEVKEKVYTADADHVWLKGLEHRKQRTILKWEQEDGTAGITQILPTPVKDPITGSMKSWISIPASKLLVFSFRKEGDNYAGISVLRSAYRHWYTKDLLYKFDAIRHERQGVGVPFIKLPEKATDEDKSVAEQILKDLRANEQSGIVLPNGWEFGFADLQAGNTSDLWKSIEHHNQMISKNILAMFMEIVGGEQGSRALSEDQSDFFLLSLEAVAKQIDTVHTRFLIPELCDLNFDMPAPSYYPKLMHRKLGSVDYSTFSSVLSTLISAGVVTVDDPLEDFTRKLMDLPARVVPETDGDGNILDDQGNPVDDQGNPIDPNAPEPALDDQGNPITDDQGNPLDVNGDPIPQGAEPALDENGEPITDENGTPLDTDGNPIEENAETEEQEADEELDDEDHAALDDLESQLQDVEVTDEEMNAPPYQVDENGDPILDENGNYIDEDGNPVDENGDPIEEDMEEMDDMPMMKKGKKMPFVEVDGQDYAVLGGEIFLVDHMRRAFRAPVSQETKQKISEALKGKYRGQTAKGRPKPRYHRGEPIPEDIRKKIGEAVAQAKPGDMKQNAANRGSARKKMQSLTQRSLSKPKAPAASSQRTAQQQRDPYSPLYRGKNGRQSANTMKKDGQTPNKTGGVIAAKRNARLAKAGKKKSSNTAAIKKAMSGVKPKAKKGSKKKKIEAIKALVKSGNPKKLKKAKADLLKIRNKAGKIPTAAVPIKTASAASKPSAGIKTAKPKQNAPQVKKKGIAAIEHVHGDPETQSRYEEYLALCDWKQIIKLQNATPRDPEDWEPRQRFNRQQFAEFTSWRPLTFAEQKVNFMSLQKALGAAAAEFEKTVDAITADQKADILAQIKRAVENNDISAIGKIKAKYTGDLSKALTDIQNQMFEIGKKSVSTEIGVKVPPTAREVAGALRVQNDALINKYIGDMETAASSAVTQVAAKRGGSITSTGTSEAVNAASDSIEKAMQQGKAALKTLSLIGTLNLGRAAIFERYPEEVAKMQYSAIIDDRTTDICLSLDGRVVAAGSPEFYQYSPPQHYNCRSIWVEILRDEEFMPDTTGIPKSIPASATIDAFEDLEAPVLEPNSQAIKVIKQEIVDRRAKIDQYKTDGQFQNRIDTHQKRIDALMSSLEDLPIGSIDISEMERIAKGGK